MVALRHEEGVWHWEAYALLEMSVFPIPHRTKKPIFGWSRLKYVKLWRLAEDKGRGTLSRFYELGGGGLAVLCGRASENLFVMDCDSHEALDRVRRNLRAQGVDAPVALSGRGGHVYLRCREGAIKGVKFDGGELKGEGGYVVMPPTQYDAEIVYRWEKGVPRHIPTVSKDELAFLGVDLEVSGGERRLHDETRAYLAHGRFLREGVRNEALFHAARDYRYVGFDVREALGDLLPIAVASGLDADEAEATIRSPYRHARGQVVDGKLSIHRKLLAFAEVVNWGPGSGRTDEAVFLALAERRRVDSHRNGGGVFRASYREIATEARFNSVSTISRSVDRLEAQGFIERMGKDSETGASLWRFSGMVLGASDFFSQEKRTLNSSFSELRSYCSYLHKASPQLKERGILGRIGYKILNLLRRVGECLAPEHVAFVIGCHISTARRRLEQLVEMGLAVGSGMYRAAALSSSEEMRIVRESGAYAQAAAREVRFDVERALFVLTPIVEWLKEQQS